MAFLVIELQAGNDGSLAQIVTKKDALPEAEQKYHSVLAAAAVSKVDIHSAVILNEVGDRLKGETYYHGQPVEEEEE